MSSDDDDSSSTSSSSSDDSTSSSSSNSSDDSSSSSSSSTGSSNSSNSSSSSSSGSSSGSGSSSSSSDASSEKGKPSNQEIAREKGGQQSGRENEEQAKPTTSEEGLDKEIEGNNKQLSEDELSERSDYVSNGDSDVDGGEDVSETDQSSEDEEAMGGQDSDDKDMQAGGGAMEHDNSDVDDGEGSSENDQDSEEEEMEVETDSIVEDEYSGESIGENDESDEGEGEDSSENDQSSKEEQQEEKTKSYPYSNDKGAQKIVERISESNETRDDEASSSSIYQNDADSADEGIEKSKNGIDGETVGMEVEHCSKKERDAVAKSNKGARSHSRMEKSKGGNGAKAQRKRKRKGPDPIEEENSSRPVSAIAELFPLKIMLLKIEWLPFQSTRYVVQDSPKTVESWLYQFLLSTSATVLHPLFDRASSNSIEIAVGPDITLLVQSPHYITRVWNSASSISPSKRVIRLGLQGPDGSILSPSTSLFELLKNASHHNETVTLVILGEGSWVPQSSGVLASRPVDVEIEIEWMPSKKRSFTMDLDHQEPVESSLYAFLKTSPDDLFHPLFGATNAMKLALSVGPNRRFQVSRPNGSKHNKQKEKDANGGSQFIKLGLRASDGSILSPTDSLLDSIEPGVDETLTLVRLGDFPWGVASLL